MLRLTKRTEYALIALRHMAQGEVSSLSTAAAIASAYDLPRELLAKALQQMAKSGYLEPVQGPKGGYQLKQKLDEISLMDFLVEMEGQLALVTCLDEGACSILETCIIKSPVDQLNHRLQAFLRTVTLSDITGTGFSVESVITN